MAKRYPKEFKEAGVKKMLSSYLNSVKDLSRNLGVTTDTLYSWKNYYLSQGVFVTSKNTQNIKWTASRNYRSSIFK
ncbi:MAG: transposase [Desulfotalea sp.]